MAKGMMVTGPRARLSDEQRQQIRDVRAEQGRGAARAMRREMRQEAGLPVRGMQNRPAPMPMPDRGQPVQAMQQQPMPMPMPMPMPGRGQMPMDQGFQVTDEQLEALRQQPPMQKPTPEMMQDAMARGRDQGLQHQPGRFPITDMMYREPMHGPMQPYQPQQPEPGYMPALRNAYETGKIPLDKISAPYRNTLLPQQQPYQFYGQQPNQFPGLAAGVGQGLTGLFR